MKCKIELLFIAIIAGMVFIGCEKDSNWRDYHFAAHRNPVTIADETGGHINAERLNRLYENRKIRTGDTVLLKGYIRASHTDRRGYATSNINCTWNVDATIDSVFENRTGDSIFVTGIIDISHSRFSQDQVFFTLNVYDNQTIYISSDEYNK